LTEKLSKTKELVNKYLSDKSIFFLTRDPERGLGIESILDNYHLVHINRSQYRDYFDEIGLKYFCLESGDADLNSYTGSSRLLLNSDKVIDYFNANKKSENYIQTFKISPAFEKKATTIGFPILNTSANLNRRFEDKISQFQNLSKFVQFPKTVIGQIGELSYLQLVQKLGDVFVVQFNRGHTGSGTTVIEDEQSFEEFAVKYKQREAKFSSYIHGIPYTVNACVTKKGVFIGGLSLQITGENELGATRGATIGNDWSRRTYISSVAEIESQVTKIGTEMFRQGFKGMFGVDVVVTDIGESYVIEVNARQTASVPMYSKIQLLQEETPLSLLHLKEYLNINIEDNPKDYNDRNLEALNFSQIFIRAEVDSQINHLVKMGSYRLQGDNAAINRYTDEIASTTIFLDEDRDKALLYQKYITNVGNMDKQSVLILTPVVGKMIKKGEEIGRIQLMQGAVDEMGTVYPWVKEALIAIKYNQK